MESVEGDLATAFFEVTTTLPFNLIPTLCTYRVDNTICSQVISLPAPNIVPLGNDISYRWNLLSLLS